MTSDDLWRAKVMRLRERLLATRLQLSDANFHRRQLKAAFEATLDLCGERQAEIDRLEAVVGETAREAYDCAQYVLDGGWGRELWLCCWMEAAHQRMQDKIAYLDALVRQGQGIGYDSTT